MSDKKPCDLQLFPHADWSSNYDTELELCNDLSVRAKRGWHLKGGDALLVIPRLNGGFTVYCWNGQDPRGELTNLAKFPAYDYNEEIQ